MAAHLLRTEPTQLRRWRNQQLAAALDALTDALARWLSDWQWQRPRGEQTLWVRLPPATRVALPRLSCATASPSSPSRCSAPIPEAARTCGSLRRPADQLIQAAQRLVGAGSRT